MARVFVYKLEPETFIFSTYTDFEAVMNKVEKFSPPKVTFAVQFSGTEI